MPVEALELGEEMGVRKEGVDDPHRIVGVERGVQHPADVPDGLHVPNRDVAGRPDKAEGLGAHMS